MTSKKERMNYYFREHIKSLNLASKIANLVKML
jgi:hypothetical protein